MDRAQLNKIIELEEEEKVNLEYDIILGNDMIRYAFYAFTISGSVISWLLLITFIFTQV